MHTHLVQLRYADLDEYRHVNNVSYARFADDALRSFVAEGGFDPAGRVATSCAIDYLRPLLLTEEPAAVVSRVEGQTVVQELFDNRRAEGEVFCRVTTGLAAAPDAPPLVQPGRLYRCSTRRIDADADGRIGFARQFEYVQESRVSTLSFLLNSAEPSRFVIGRAALNFHRPMVWRPEPYEVFSWVEAVGNTSVTLRAQFTADGVVHSEATTRIVGFDLESERSRPWNDVERSLFGELTR